MPTCSSLLFPTALTLCAAGCAATAPRPLPLAAARSTRAAASPAAAALAPGETRAALTARDARDARGAHVQRYALTLDPARRVRLRMRSRALDAMLALEGPGGFRVDNDDAYPRTLDALLDFVPPVAGRYELVATTAAPGQTGDYTLEYTTREPAGIGAPITIDGAFTGELGAATDPVVPGTWMHFGGTAGTVVRLRVTSGAFDTVATVIGPRGERWVNDDANDRGPDGTERALDSTLEIALPETGTYQLIVSSYGAGGAGPFRVAARSRPPVVLRDGEQVPAMPYAGPEGRGRLYGVYAGITAYNDHRALYGCADDPRLLAEALRASHLQSAREQTVLTDAAATRAAFMEGLARLAQTATPDDVVLVFWSGHGGQQPAPPGDRSEIDGLDETIVLMDGALTDTEVAAALGRVRAGTIILALDSCNSGGFADDWVAAPGRIGLFSSDEDVLSDTAESRRAGGYLSYYLRRGVLGEADARPRDGVLSAGELTDYLAAGFVADDAAINGRRAREPYQHLVARRGAVGWGRTLWVYPRRPDFSLPPVPPLALQSAPP